MDFGLNSDVIEKVQSIFLRYKEVEQVIVYGSRAKGNYKPGSDIDLTLKGEGISLKTTNSISNDLDDLLLPYTFDISIYHQIENPELIKHIDMVGKVFYDKISKS